MSAQFGRWNFEGSPSSPEYMEKITAVLAPYGPDSNGSYCKDGLGILYCAFHTTKESHAETQPHTSPSGSVITWDGRLDNRAELISELGDDLTISSTDAAIVAAAYEQWSTTCFANLIGDWALSIWNPGNRTLILAKDPIGTRHLYYSVDQDHISWSTILDPLILFAGKTFKICEEYMAGCFACYPAAHLTPYVGIHAVPPSSSVLIRPGKHIVSKYWDFDPGRRIRYRTDGEYEEHFRTVFAKAVRRRLRSDRPILAELSGGMDSSSIVCMADIIIARGESETPCLDTVSYHDDSDPVLDERPYFTEVEQRRGRTGYHINLGAQKRTEGNEVDSRKSLLSSFENCRLAATPESSRILWPELFDLYTRYLRSREYRVTLSGVGGENPTGGFVPTPRLELQDLLTKARFFELARQLNAWAAKMRKPRLRLLWEALRGFFTFSLTFPGAPKDMRPAPWFNPGFVRRNHAAFHWYPSRVKLFIGLPSFQNQIQLLNHERRLIAYLNLSPELPREIRYPYLDRDLLEFACAVPQQQIVGVGRRRFLMKRALVGIVPDEILNRKQRASVMREREKDTSPEWPSSAEMGRRVIGSALGFIDLSAFLEALQKAQRNEEARVDSLKRTLFLESWLRHLSTQGVLKVTPRSRKGLLHSSVEAKEPPALVQPKSSAS